MSGFSSYDQYINAITVNKAKLKMPFIRTINTGATSVAGRFHECLSVAGTGGAMTVTGTPGTGIVMDSTKAGAIPFGGNVGTSLTKHLQSMTVFSPSATIAPGLVQLVDIIHIYPSCVVVSTPSTLSNHPTWTGTGDTRMTNANGVQAGVFLSTAGSAAGQLTLTYKDQAGNDQAQSGSLFSPIAAHPAGAFYGQVPASATVGPPQMAFANGDYGVRQVNSYAINAGTTGATACIVLYRPICEVPILLANQASVFDFTTGPDAFPRIYDDSCLGFLVSPGGALTTSQIIAGSMDFVWN